jgi:hypothetical protein
MLRQLIRFLIGLLRAYRGTERQPRASFAETVLLAMRTRHHRIDSRNIVYLYGYNPDGTPNGRPKDDRFNDVRLILDVDADGKPTIVKAWKATIDPGHYYTFHPIVSGGTAMIKAGQYRAWQVGSHRGDHEALVQTGGLVTVMRDANKSYARDAGDWEQTGYYGINQHGPGSRTGHQVQEFVGPFSAGCLVAESMDEHREFMRLVKEHPGYKANPHFIFTTTVLI